MRKELFKQHVVPKLVEIADKQREESFNLDTETGTTSLRTEYGRIPVMATLVIEKTHPDAVVPTYASEGDSGMDVYATEDMLIYPGETKLAKLGFKMEIPRHPLHNLGYRWECQARPRSGVSLKTDLRVANAPGTIDNFYRQEVGIILTNSATTTQGVTPLVKDLKGNIIETGTHKEQELRTMYPVGTYVIKKGDRIAQLVFNEVIRPIVIVEDTVDMNVDRGGGYGHTGV